MSTGAPLSAAAPRASASRRSRQVRTLTGMRRPARVMNHALPAPSTSTIWLACPLVSRPILRPRSTHSSAQPAAGSTWVPWTRAS